MAREFVTILGGGPYDIILGTFATLLGAVGTRLLRKHKSLAPLPPMDLEELVSCGVLGIVLLLALEKRNIFK